MQTIMQLVDKTRRPTKNKGRRARVRELYYLTHIKNIPSILREGILSHERIEKEGIEYTPIYDKEIVSRRKDITVPDGRSLWSFANLFFRARNPMLYRVTREKSIDDIAVLGLRKSILNRNDIFLANGNAAHGQSKIMPIADGRKAIYKIAKETSRDWWSIADGSKRKIMAECLVPSVVPPQAITSIYVASHTARDKVNRLLSTVFGHGLFVIYQPFMFFEPNVRFSLPKNLKIVEGDMFFSRMHTLTVSVNTVGVMGKGLASRAKYQFPDVYVRYQDTCRNRTLRMGKPYLYKRESFFEYELADEPLTLSNAPSETWFLFFATKKHWRKKADINGIEAGLQWVCETYKKNGIKSFAVPSLGCGLGWLDWRDVLPLMCRYLSTLDIPVELYLPVERAIPDKFLSEKFLLPQLKV